MAAKSTELPHSGHEALANRSCCLVKPHPNTAMAFGQRSIAGTLGGILASRRSTEAPVGDGTDSTEVVRAIAGHYVP